jgi:hypothetical protein
MKRYVCRTALLILTLTLAGCAAYNPVPKDYTGPLASIADSGWPEDFSKAQIFAAVEIDGHFIEDSFELSRRASHGQGPVLRLMLASRQIPAQPLKVRIRGSHATGMPIHEFASRALGTFFEVEGVVEFRPQPNGSYRVAGSLAKEGSRVWIEDAATSLPVTEKIADKQKSDAETAAKIE